MEITDIIKESFIFPSNNMDKLAIFIVLSFVMGLLLVGGIFLIIYGIDSYLYLILGIILFILSLIVAFITSGYQINIIKSGIDLEDNAPDFDWKNNAILGIKNFVLSIVYLIIPTIVTVIMAFITNIPGNFTKATQEYAIYYYSPYMASNSTSAIVPGVSDATMSALLSSMVITAIVAIIVFIIFLFIQTIAEARLANTNSLTEGINIPEVLKDIPRIGVSKTIAVILLLIIVSGVIQAILGYLSGVIQPLAILSIIVTPYLAFFLKRGVGLLYSDIA